MVSSIYWNGKKHPDGTLFTGSARRFHYGLAAYLLAATTKQKSYWTRRGLKMERELQHFAKHGDVNVVHLLQILSAARMAIEQNGDEANVRGAYDLAITTSLRSGFLADAALCSHRAAIYFRGTGDEQKMF